MAQHDEHTHCHECVFCLIRRLKEFCVEWKLDLDTSPTKDSPFAKGVATGCRTCGEELRGVLKDFGIKKLGDSPAIKQL